MATYTVRMPDGSTSTHRSLSGAQSAVRAGGFDSYTVDDRTSRGVLGGGRTTGVSADRSARDVRRDLGSRPAPVFGGGGLLGGLFGGGQRTPQAGDGALFGYNSFNDMIDGGGPGASGDRFQGGGLYSLLANVIARPRRAAQMPASPALAPQGAGLPAGATPLPAPAPAPDTRAMAPAAAPTRLPIDMRGVVRGSGATPATAYVPRGRGVPTSDEYLRSMGVEPMTMGVPLRGSGAGLLPPGTDLPGRLPTFDPALRPSQPSSRFLSPAAPSLEYMGLY